MPKGRAERLVQPAEIFFVVCGVGERTVDRRWWVGRRIVVRLMQRDGKDLEFAIVAGVDQRLRFMHVATAGACAGQRVPNARLAPTRLLRAAGGKDGCRTVAVVDVEVHGYGSPHTALLIHPLDCYSPLVKHTQTLPLSGKHVRETPP